MKPFDYDRYGRPGSAIPGSRFVRGYCPVCGAPVRASTPQSPPPCFDCDGHERPGGYGGPAEDVSGWQANAIRALEDS